MARLRDAATVLHRVGPFQFTRRVWKEVDEDNLFAWASSLSYSWILGLFPFLIFLLTLIPYLPSNAKVEAQRQIESFIDTFPQAASTTLESFLRPRFKALLDEQRKGLLTIGILVTLWAASGGVSATTTALDKVWDIDARRSFVRRRISAIALTLIVSFLLMLILFILPIGTLIMHWLWHFTKGEHQLAVILIDSIRWTIAVMVMFLMLEVVYFFGPNIKQHWRWVSPGSLFCAVVWVGLGLLFKFYVDKFGKYNETYGAVGGVAVLLIVFYVDALALLIGAEINSEIDFEILKVPRGSRIFTRPAAKLLTPDD